jgi:excisionase family DNA binding protein
MSDEGRALAQLDEAVRSVVDEGLMTVPEAAAFLRISRTSLYDLMDRGDLPFVKLGKSRRVPRRAVVDLAARCLTGGQRGEGGVSQHPRREGDA